jgi:hypothetical protein
MMKMNLMLSLAMGCLLALLTGCVGTIDGGSKAGMPLAKDTIVKRYDRSSAQTSAAVREVLSRRGTLIRDHIQANTLEATVDGCTVWVKVEGIEPRVTEVTVQARAHYGADINLAADITTEVALQLTKSR